MALTKTELYKIFKQCQKDLREIDIPIAENLAEEIRVNSRAKSRWGRCSLEIIGGRRTYVIQIRDILVTRETIPGLKETIYHELLHTVEGCMNHGAKWKMLAAKANLYLRTNITTASSAASKGISESLQMATAKYAIKCESCGTIYNRSRETAAIKNPNKYSCGCGGSLVRVK